LDERERLLRGLVITSVGTGIGKTLVTATLCYQLTRAGRSVRALKPVVSGFRADDPASDPCLILRSLGENPTPRAIATIAPWRFEPPIAPHLAARREDRVLALDEIADFCTAEMCQNDACDHLLIEGAGGVMAPIDEKHTVLDLIVRLGHPAVLVTGSYLGAISHTLTALEVLASRGVAARAVVVSESETSAGLSDTIASIRQFGALAYPVYALPRLAGGEPEKWRAAPSLVGLCDPFVGQASA
jgi:dethiobiotin synthetase